MPARGSLSCLYSVSSTFQVNNSQVKSEIREFVYKIVFSYPLSRDLYDYASITVRIV